MFYIRIIVFLGGDPELRDLEIGFSGKAVWEMPVYAYGF